MIRYIERADYRPPAYRVERAELVFELDLERTLIRSRLELVRTASARPGEALCLDGRDFELLSLHLNGVPLTPSDYTFADDVLTIASAPARCVLEAVTAVSPSVNRSQMGLFQAGRCLVTQCEADGFRRMTFYLDRPDVMAAFRVRLEGAAEHFPVLLSNGDCIEQGTLGDGRHFAVWDDPHPKPSYVFAVMAGDLAALRDSYTTGSGKSVELVIYAEPQHIDDCSFAMGALKRALAWDEAAYGLEYDLSRYSIVAIDEYSGAMENKGLNLFEAKGILANPAYSTDNDYLVLERILGHEVFHNWTGNRVTCRDWFELCLKEGLTRFRDRQFAEAMSAPGPKRIDTVALLRRNQYVEDDGNAAHPVKPERYADVQNLYTATVYEKGAELMRMLWVLLGSETFSRGVGLFLQRHDGQAVTTEELLTALEEVSGRDLTQFRRWYGRAGRPRLRADEHYDPAARRYELRLSQHPPGPDASEPLFIPVSFALFDVTSDGGVRMLREGVLELSEASQTLRIDEVERRPVVSLLRGLSAPVSLDIERGDSDLATLMAHEPDPVARWDAAQQFATTVIRRLATGAPWERSGAEAFAVAFGEVLSDRITDPALLARLLTLPDEPTLSDDLARVDVDGHAQARDRLRAALAERLAEALLERYRALTDDGPYTVDAPAMARRALRNTCLDLLLAAPDPVARQMSLQQIEASDNMNDAYAALAALCHLRCPERDQAVAMCLARWRSHSLALGQWLIAQALGKADDTVDRVIGLSQHPDIDVQDPAQGMALFGSFFRQNRVVFHHASGRGYEFLADVLLRVDRVRPSGSFWLMPQINQWRRFDPHRQVLMRQALERIRDTAGISRGLAENVARALETTPLQLPSGERENDGKY